MSSVSFPESTRETVNDNNNNNNNNNIIPRNNDREEQEQNQHRYNYHYNRMKSTKDRDEATIVPLLARRAYHLPGNNWCEDWIQYMSNNHPFFGICCHHKFHPLSCTHRIIMFVASVAFGIITTNAIVLYYTWKGDDDDDDLLHSVALEINYRNGRDDNDSNSIHGSLKISNGMLVSWTTGSILHTIFDLTIWYIAMCSCCRVGGSCTSDAAAAAATMKPQSPISLLSGCCQYLGSYFVFVLAMVLVIMATSVVVMRASIESRKERLEEELENDEYGDDDDDDYYENGVNNDDDIALGEVDSVENFGFLIWYLVELAMAHFVYWPFFATVLLSGILGCCGRLPFLGGRPRELFLLDRQRLLRERLLSREEIGD